MIDNTIDHNNCHFHQFIIMVLHIKNDNISINLCCCIIMKMIIIMCFIFIYSFREIKMDDVAVIGGHFLIFLLTDYRNYITITNNFIVCCFFVTVTVIITVTLILIKFIAVSTISYYYIFIFCCFSSFLSIFDLFNVVFLWINSTFFLFRLKIILY